ncbi:hypothetical protein QZH41_018592 [Actinostola sp. cb2023]|nr:hypothetical protein QZH41_018592 [Actinostola sp. cb2023]
MTVNIVHLPHCKKRRVEGGLAASLGSDGDFDSQVRAVQARKSCSWINMDGVPVQEGQPCALDVSSILSASQDPQLASVSLRDPTHFIAGGIRTNPDAWEKILVGHPSADVLRDWIWNKIDV